MAKLMAKLIFYIIIAYVAIDLMKSCTWESLFKSCKESVIGDSLTSVVNNISVTANYAEIKQTYITCNNQYISLKLQVTTLNSEYEQLAKDIKELDHKFKRLSESEQNVKTENLYKKMEEYIEKFNQCQNDLVTTKQEITTALEKLKDENSSLSKADEDMRSKIEQIEEDLITLTNNVTIQLTQLTTLAAKVEVIQTTIYELHVTVNKIINPGVATSEESKIDKTYYYYIDTEDNLISQGIASKNFFGLGPLKINESSMDKDLFIPCTESMLSLPLTTGEAEVISDMPDEAWTIKTVNGMQVLVIKDTEKFWSNTIYLVVKVDNKDL